MATSEILIDYDSHFTNRGSYFDRSAGDLAQLDAVLDHLTGLALKGEMALWALCATKTNIAGQMEYLKGGLAFLKEVGVDWDHFINGFPLDALERRAYHPKDIFVRYPLPHGSRGDERGAGERMARVTRALTGKITAILDQEGPLPNKEGLLRMLQFYRKISGPYKKASDEVGQARVAVWGGLRLYFKDLTFFGPAGKHY